jgi:aryl-alcohol dehydrogenase-like predicted oxidoreductase
MGARAIRDQIVLTTKYTTGYRTYRSDEIQANFVRNSTRNLRLSVEASLKKLRTSYMDLVAFQDIPPRYLRKV